MGGGERPGKLNGPSQVAVGLVACVCRGSEVGQEVKRD